MINFFDALKVSLVRKITKIIIILRIKILMSKHINIIFQISFYQSLRIWN